MVCIDRITFMATDPECYPIPIAGAVVVMAGLFRQYGTSVVTARKVGDLIGLLPLYVLDEPGCRKLLPFGIGLSDYFDAMIDPDSHGLGDTLLESLIAVPGAGTSAICGTFRPLRPYFRRNVRHNFGKREAMVKHAPV
jgi:hypothetical protein